MRHYLGAWCICIFVSGCSHLHNKPLFDDEIATLIDESELRFVAELAQEIVLFENVALGLGLPLRKYLKEDKLLKGKSILDLGAGSGVLSLIALNYGAKKAVATDINPYAVANATYNAKYFGFEDQMDVRLVSLSNQGAYSVIDKDERFDLIVSNPPQTPVQPKSISEFSFADPKRAFFRSILAGLKEHLSPNGKGVFALYAQTLELARQVANQNDLNITIHLITHNKNGIYYIVEIR